MKFKELAINQCFTFTPRKDAFPSEIHLSTQIYRKFDKRGYTIVRNDYTGFPPDYFKVGTINVDVSIA